MTQTVDRFASRPALVDGLQRLTWGDVAIVAQRRANALHARGVTGGQAVALVLANSSDFVTSFLAIQVAGAIAVPLNPQLTAHEIAQHLTASELVGIIAEPQAVTNFRDWLSALPSHRRPWVETADALDAGGAPAPVAIDGATPALLAFSSGSTGTPKAMIRTNANLACEAHQFSATVDIDEHDVILAVVALFHAHGLGNCVLAALRTGAALVVLRRFERDAVLSAIADERVTIFPGVPFIFQTLAETRRARLETIGALRLCFSAGAPLPKETFELFDRRFRVPVRQLYGCSEAGSVTINTDADPSATCTSVGRPMRGVEVAVSTGDGSRRKPCAAGETGEISFRSGALTSGYIGTDAVDNEAFEDGWFRTGDVGHCDESGNLYVTGRSTLFISTGGYKVDPFEVEEVLRRQPGVADVVVLGAKGPHGDQLVKAVVVRDGSIAEKELREAVIAASAASLAPFKVPRILEFRDEIPRSPLGKVLLKDLV
jgi:long-chain acyl-CoA synthetase